MKFELILIVLLSISLFIAIIRIGQLNRKIEEISSILLIVKESIFGCNATLAKLQNPSTECVAMYNATKSTNSPIESQAKCN